MALGTGDMGGPAPENTDKQEGAVERTVDFVKEVIAYPTRNRDGSVTHGPDAELLYDPADIPPMAPAPAPAPAEGAPEPVAAADPEPFGTPVPPVEPPAIVADTEAPTP